MRRLVAVCAVLAIVIAACGDDDAASTDSSASETTGTETTDSAAPDSDAGRYVAALEAALVRQTQEEDLPWGASESRCIAEGVVGAIDPDGFESLGVAPDDIERDADALFTSDLTEEQATAIADVTFDCVDMGAAMIASGDLPAGVDDEGARCFGERLEESDVFRRYAVESILAGTDAAGQDLPLTDDDADALVDAMLDCIDFGEVMVAQAPIDISDQSAECIGDRIEQVDAFRDAMARALTGEQALDFEELGLDVQADMVEIFTACLTPEEMVRLGQSGGGQ
jgi:hypothetical protein